jgi:hypothetical protein
MTTEDTTVSEVTEEQMNASTNLDGSIVEAEGDVESVAKEEPEVEAEVQEEVVESYELNPKFTVKGEDKEFDEWVRSAVTSKEQEDQLRDLYTKAHGLDPIKAKYEEVNTQHGKLRGDYDEVIGTLSELDYYAKNKNFHNFFDKIGIPQQDVVNYVAELLREQDMDPADQMRAQQLRQSQVEQWQYNQQSDVLMQQNEQLRANAHELAYANALSAPDVAEFQRNLDAKLGEGKFRSLADQFGQDFFRQNKRDTTPDLAVRSVMKEYEAIIGPAVQDTSSLSAATKELDSGKPGGVIPRVGRKTGSSPVAKKEHSIEALRRKYESMAS